MKIKSLLLKKAKQLKAYIVALYLSLRESSTPPLAKLMAALTIGYALSPIDLIPDFIPVLGYLDDLIILPAMIILTIKLIPKELWREKLLAVSSQEIKLQKRWYYGIPIMIFWILIIYYIIKLIINFY